LLDSKALTKIQSIILIAVIVVAAVGVGAAYVLLSQEDQSSDTIKIGVLTDLDTTGGRNRWQAVVLAAEQLNKEGGILGKQVEVVGEDTDSELGDATKFNLALTRLLTYHNVDFIIGDAGPFGFMVQESIAEHKRIFFEISSSQDEYTQRVLDDYDKCKYFFRVMFNASSIFQGMTDGILLLRELTGFNRVGILAQDLSWTKGIMEGLDYVLPEVYGFELVYKDVFPPEIVDFSSYYAAVESAGVKVLMPLIAGSGAIPFVKEYSDRQSPMVIYGGYLSHQVAGPEGWVNTDGKCEYTTSGIYPISAGYPLTSKTLPVREAYIDRWGEIPTMQGATAYDTLRYILPDAIRRAGTLDTDAVIQSLETTSIEISNARNFVFTSSHDLMMGENPNDPEAEYAFVIYFQWQNEELVPIYPKKIMEEAEATYLFPPWPGPWD